MKEGPRRVLISTFLVVLAVSLCAGHGSETEAFKQKLAALKQKLPQLKPSAHECKDHSSGHGNEKIADQLVDDEVAQEDRMKKRMRAFGAGYLAVAPKIMCAGGREKVFITFVNFTQPVDVMFGVMENEYKTLAISPLEVFKTPCGCVELDLPHIDQARMTVTLIMYAKRSLIQCEEFEVIDKIKVFLDACNSETFIETDKSVYKAGQELKFRILTLQSDLTPDLSTVSKIWVESPSGIHMEQWLNIDSTDGLVDLTMPLSDQAPLGKWKIKVRHHDREFEQMFEVGEPIIPKFEVIIDSPEYVVSIEPIDVTVCGRYTYGQPVKGSIKMVSALSKAPYKTVTTSIPETDSDGCHTFKVDWRALSQMSHTSRRSMSSQQKLRLIVNVEFEESATRVLVQKTSDKTMISSTRWLEFSVPATFKPDLPFSGMLVIKDHSGNPFAGGEATLTAWIDKKSDPFYREVLISNDRGIAFFTLTDIPSNATRFDLEAQTGRRAPRVKRVIHRHYSPSNSFIHVVPVIERAKVKSYQTLTMNLISGAPEYEGVHLQTVVMSRGNIILGVETIISPDDIDGFRRPGQFGVFPINTDEMGMKEYTQSLSMRASDVPVHFLKKGQPKTTTLRIKVSYEMSPVVTVMVYYVRYDGEVVADTINIAVEEVLRNQVSIKFAETDVLPGDETTLNILAKPSSLCAYGVVDKSVHLLGDKNLITKEKIFKSLEDLQLSAEGGFAGPYSKKCPIEESGEKSFIQGLPGKRGIQLPDASQSFKNLGAVYLTNLLVETAPCSKRFDMLSNTGQVEGVMSSSQGNPVLMMAEPDITETDEIGGETAMGGPDIRSYFPETWLYKLARVSRDGHLDVPVAVPHSITEWVGHGFCTSTRYGAGVSELTTLKTFQPFFVDMTLPYSVIRNEDVPVTVTVFNYLTECLVVELTLQPSEQFEIEHRNRVEYTCVCSQESKAVSYYIKPTVTDIIGVEVRAVTVPDSNNLCDGKEMATTENGFRDAVKKSFVVKPEGVETQQVFSAYFCPEEQPGDTYEETITLQDLPDNYVSGSERAVVKVTGDILGPAVSNLDRLLNEPSGSGYKTMPDFTLNVRVLHYLKGIHQLSDDIEAKSMANMESGYQLLMTFRRKDGSYSANGDYDTRASNALTAHAIRSFVLANHYIDVDPQIVEKAQAWLISQQNAVTKCFKPPVLMFHSHLTSEQIIVETANVVISLIESGVAPDDQTIQDSIGCIQKKINMDTVNMDTLAIASYAYILAGYPHKDDVMARLEELAIESDDGMKHWEGRPEKLPGNTPAYLHRRAPARFIESTSYVLLSYIRAYSKEQVLVLGKPVSRWIIAQLNAFGGFVSTQDTMIALQALTEYSLMAYNEGPQDVKLNVRFSCEETDHLIEITEHDRLLMKTLPVPQVPVQIKMTATGPGCAMTQVIATYNVYPEEQDMPPFKITIENKAQDVSCIQYSMFVCVSFTGDGESSNMALMEMRMVSGFEVDGESLKTLESSAGLPGNFNKFDQEGDDVFFYFDKIDREGTCVQMDVSRRILVDNYKDAAITVSDYYERALSTSRLYNFPCYGPKK